MSNILSAFLLLFLLGAAFSPDLSCSLENPKKNWYDYTDSKMNSLGQDGQRLKLILLR